MVKRNTIIAVAVVAIIVVLGFLFFPSPSTSSNNLGLENTEDETSLSVSGTWRNTELKDVNSGETFKVSDFSEKPILIESFAVWCPTCTRQQREIRGLHDIVGEEVISISLDTDPNEDESKVIEHVQRNGFNWRYAVSPIEFTQELIDEFGITIANAPSAPVVLVCPNSEQGAKLLRSGVKQPDELIEAIENTCGVSL